MLDAFTPGQDAPRALHAHLSFMVGSFYGLYRTPVVTYILKFMRMNLGAWELEHRRSKFEAAVLASDNNNKALLLRFVGYL